MNIILKDGSIKTYEKPISIIEIVKDLGVRLLKSACAATVDDNLVDLRFIIHKDCRLTILTFEQEIGRAVYRNTSSLILAQAVKRLYPKAILGGGSYAEEGFYYDIDFNFPINYDHLIAIEDEMRKIIKEQLEINEFTLPKEEAIPLMRDKREDYKVQLLMDISEGEAIHFYSQGEYVDISSGPQLCNTGLIKAIKLTSIAGAYWKGNEKNKMLTRIYGTSFLSNNDLKEYLDRLEEIKRRDHRRIGKELSLFTILEEGPGFPFLLPKGLQLKNLLVEYWRNIHAREGYMEISSPIILEKSLWETSGHWEHYKENMYTLNIDEDEYAIKPMNCPGGMLIFKSSIHSYRDLPCRIGELGIVHRHEKSGALHGLMRVRSFTQDDAHIFMTEEQITDEIKNVIRLINEVYHKFGFSYYVELSTRPENSIGSDSDWENATTGLKNALEDLHMGYVINEGDGAFYGPKIDFHLKDSMGRSWQCGTIQLDFQLPLRFHAEYIGADGEKHRPIMLHRVVYGAIERFMGILIEHYAGEFPVWLSPVQVKILPLSSKYNSYAVRIMEELKKNNIRVELDNRDEKIGYKIREARLDKVPYMLILGGKEEENGTVSVRDRENGETKEVSLIEFVDILKEESKF